MFDERSGNGYSPYSNWTPVSGDWQELTFTVLGAMNSDIGEFIISVYSTVGPEHIGIDDVTISRRSFLPWKRPSRRSRRPRTSAATRP